MSNKRDGRCAGWLVFGLALSANGCISLTTVSIGTKTSLERQLIGELEPLSDEETLAASVRAQGAVGLGSFDEAQAAAIRARRRQLFNRDDIDEAKRQGCLGETRDAHLAPRTCHGALAADASARLDRLMQEENVDRDAIIDWAVAADPSLTPAERPQVVQVYRRLLTERAQAGDWLQHDDGTWVKR